MKISLPLLFSILVLIQLSHALSINLAHDIDHDFCWKNSYGRGVGTIATSCVGRERVGLLCYTLCPQGYSRVGLDCQQDCPTGFRDDGLFCRRAEYGRGVGYPWQFNDELSDKGMISRCEADHGEGNCEKNLLMYYPKCKPGYHPFGCCICRPEVPDCTALGLKRGIDLSCAKNLILASSPVLPECPKFKQYDGALCYSRCKRGYYGVGPVCWSETPSGWVGCGMGAAKDTKNCVGALFDQISSVGQLAINIATLGSSSIGVEAANAAQSAGKITSLTKKLKELKAAVLASPKIAKVAEEAKKLKKLKEAGEKIK